MRNKKGDIDTIIFMSVILFVILFLGIGLAFGTAIIDWVADETVPELTNLGVIGAANLTDVAGKTITPVNTFIQSFTFLSGVLYLFGIIACFGMAFAFRFTGNKWLAAFFILVLLMLVISSIFISNIYEEFFNDQGDLASRLREQTFLSFFVLYSPMIMSIIGAVCGIIMFTGEGGEQTV